MGSTGTVTVSSFLSAIYSELLYPVLTVLFAIAFVYFLWGVVRYIWGAEDDDTREKGKRHMIWGLVGLVIMFGAVSIVAIIKTTVGQL